MQANGISLTDIKIGQGAEKFLSVFELAFRIPESHGTAAIEGEVASEIRFGFVFLQVVPVGPGKDSPIHPFRVFPWGVFPVFGEFNTGTFVGAAVVPRHGSLHGERG